MYTPQLNDKALIALSEGGEAVLAGAACAQPRRWRHPWGVASHRASESQPKASSEQGGTARRGCEEPGRGTSGHGAGTVHFGTLGCSSQIVPLGLEVPSASTTARREKQQKQTLVLHPRVHPL